MTQAQAIAVALLEPGATVQVLARPDGDYAGARLCADPEDGARIVFHPRSVRLPSGASACLDCGAGSVVRC